MSKIQINNFIDTAQVKKATSLSDTQITEVTKAMNNYNKLPEEIKDGSNTSTQSTVNTTTAKEVEKNEASTLEKVASWVGEFGSVRASAGYSETENLINNLWNNFNNTFRVGFNNNTVSIKVSNWVIGGLAYAAETQKTRIFVPVYRLLINTCYIFWWVVAACIAINAVLASAIVWTLPKILALYTTCWGGVRINMNYKLNLWVDCL